LEVVSFHVRERENTASRKSGGASSPSCKHKARPKKWRSIPLPVEAACIYCETIRRVVRREREREREIERERERERYTSYCSM